MNWDRANKYLQTGANFGILAGLILVGIQILETNRITQAQFNSDALAVTMSSYDLRIGESLPGVWGKASTNLTNLTEEELVILDSYLTREWYRSIRERVLSTEGLST